MFQASQIIPNWTGCWTIESSSDLAAKVINWQPENVLQLEHPALACRLHSQSQPQHLGLPR